MQLMPVFYRQNAAIAAAKCWHGFGLKVADQVRNKRHQSRFDDVDAAARLHNLTVVPIDLRRLPDEAAAQIELRSMAVQVLLILPDDGLFWGYVNRIISAGTALRLPSIFPRRDLVEMGALMSYGVDDREVFRRSATHVDRILNGARPNDIPIEHPNRTELTVSTRRAAAYGVVIPRATLLRADWVVK